MTAERFPSKKALPLPQIYLPPGSLASSGPKLKGFIGRTNLRYSPEFTRHTCHCSSFGCPFEGVSPFWRRANVITCRAARSAFFGWCISISRSPSNSRAGRTARGVTECLFAASFWSAAIRRSHGASLLRCAANVTNPPGSSPWIATCDAQYASPFPSSPPRICAPIPPIGLVPSGEWHTRAQNLVAPSRSG